MSRVAYEGLRSRALAGLSGHPGLLGAGATVVLICGDFFSRFARSPSDWQPWLVSAILLVLLVVQGLRRSSLPRHAQRLDSFERGVLVLSCIYALIQATGGLRSEVQPLAYLTIALLVGFCTRTVAVGLVGVAVVFQSALHVAAGDLGNLQGLAAEVLLIVGFAGANLVCLGAEVTRRRRESARRLAEERRSLQEEARNYRLLSGSSSAREREPRSLQQSKLLLGGVDAIHQSMFFALELLKRSLGLHTCVVLWLDDTGRQLRVREIVSDSRRITETLIPAQAGVLGGVVKNRILLNLRRPARGLPYYDEREEVGAFVGVPIIEADKLCGVLCADRKREAPFGETEERLLVAAADQVLRTIQTERALASVERSKYEHERFYCASSLLNGALTLSQVYETAFTAAREIVSFDFGAITLYDRSDDSHTICRVLGNPRKQLEGKSFPSNAGLVSMAVKNKHFLPAVENARSERRQSLFGRGLQPERRHRSLLVLPLVVQDHAIGTFVLGASDRGRFPAEIRDMLGVISNQVAVSIENAKMYKKMEEMATTDGLTGLPNHRSFQARLAEMLNRAERHSEPLAVVLSDVDHFKQVNDTYGHPVGDAVLRKVAAILAAQVRKVDHVARYGGEEFVMVLEGTDAAGARLLCERVRRQIAGQMMSSDKGAFRVTASLGVASYPIDGRDKTTLVERADQALYAAKGGGRNRTMLASAQTSFGRRAAS